MHPPSRRQPRTPRGTGGHRVAVFAAVAALAGSCIHGSKTTPNLGAGAEPELVFCRVHATLPANDRIALRTARNLGTGSVAGHSGRELHVRVHPDGQRVVFTRQRTAGVAATAEIYVSGIGAATAEERLTADATADEHPCWSPTGDRVLFATDRDGERRLYVASLTSTVLQPLLAVDPGTADDEPDWNRATDRIVFVRRTAGSNRLFLLNGDGTGLWPLTTARPSPQVDIGAHMPAFAPDGHTVAFVEVVGTGASRLRTVDVDTGIEHALFDPQGEVSLPRYSPTGDRIFCGLSQPDLGRQGLRLAVLTASGADPVLVEPGEQWSLGGIDVLPAMLPAPAAAAAEVLDLRALQVQLSSGIVVQGNTSMLATADGQSLVLATETFNDHEIASINCVWTLPVAAPDDVLALRVRIAASVTRSDTATTLRTSLHNPVAHRFDTVTELPDPGTATRTLTFATQSLAHVSLERQVRFSVIGEIGQGARAELHIDQVQLELVRAQALVPRGTAPGRSGR